MVGIDSAVVRPADVCDFPQLAAHVADDHRLFIDDQDDDGSDNFRVVVYRPDDDGDWPDEPPATGSPPGGSGRILW